MNTQTQIGESHVRAIRAALGEFDQKSFDVVVEGIALEEFGMTALELASKEFDKLHEKYLRARKTQEAVNDGIERMRAFREDVLPIVQAALRNEDIAPGMHETFVDAMVNTYEVLVVSEQIAKAMHEEGFEMSKIDSEVVLKMTVTIKNAFCKLLDKPLEPFREITAGEVTFL